MLRFLSCAVLLLMALASCGGPGPAAVPVSGIDLEGLDTRVRPQDDFNRYVNGGWIDRTAIPEDQATWGTFFVLRRESDERQRAIIEEIASREAVPETDDQRIGDFFRSYMDTERLDVLGSEPVRGDLARIRELSSAGALLVSSARLGRMGIPGPLGLYFDQDSEDSGRYRVYLTQGGLTLPDRDYYFGDEAEYQSLRSGLEAYARRLFDLAGVEDAGGRARAVLAVETGLASYHWPAEDRRDVRRTYNPYRVDDLGSLTGAIDWDAFLGAAGLGEIGELVVRMPSYVEGLGGLLSGVPAGDWQSYYMFRVLDQSAPYLSTGFEAAAFDFHGRQVSGLDEPPPRWRRATAAINELLGEAVGRHYVERHFSPEARVRVETLVANLVEAFGEDLRTADWMGPETRARAEEKRRRFSWKIGYPDVWRDYSAYRVEVDDLLGNIRRGREFEYLRNLGRLGGAVDRTEWFLTPQVVNAYHNYTMNEIVFPAAILQPPFFDPEADDAVNYGAIGAVIGHEIGHAFDDQGRAFDGGGNMSDWWTEEDAAAFAERADRLVAYFDRFEVLDGLHVNGRLTLGENIGDLAGVTTAYAAWRLSLGGAEAPVIDGLTGPERFFMGYARMWRMKQRPEALRAQILGNPHSPAEFRINGILPHVEAFYDAFDLREGDGMWLPPDQRMFW